MAELEDQSSPPELHERVAAEAARMSFGDHLEELRTCVIRALLGLSVATGLALFFGTHVLQVLFYPLWRVQAANGLQPTIQSLSPTDTFSAYLKMSLMAGLIVAMPWVLLQVWNFVYTGLYAHERRFVKRLTLASAGLFAVGVLFLYFLVLPVVLQFFISFNRAFEPVVWLPAPHLQNTEPLSDDTPPRPRESTRGEGEEPANPAGNNDSRRSSDTSPSALEGFRVPLLGQDPSNPQPGQLWVNTRTRRLNLWWQDRPWSMALTPGAIAPAVESQFAVPAYISFVLMLALAFGIAFETPIVVLFLVWSNLVPVDTFGRYRRHVILGIVFASAILTPTTDLLSQSLLAGPMYLLFEAGLAAAKLMERKRRASAETV